MLGESTSRADIDFADAAKNPRTERASEIHRTFNSVLKSAHSDYSKARIKLTSEGVFQPDEISNKSKSRSRSPKLPAVKGRVIHVPRKRKCERHPDNPTMLVPTKNPSVRSLIDLAFTKTGCKKTVLKYIGKMGRCPQCGQTYVPPGFKQVQNQVYGEGFAIWVIYLRMVLRLSFQLISNATRDFFGVEFSKQAAEGFVHRWSQKYIHTEELLLDQILQSPAVHVDETRISILGDQQYVWVLTDGKRSVFRLTEGRETDFLRDVLKDYKGALIADFYGGYDALPYRQQKCLVHLIRDLNDDLWKNPFNLEFEQFVAAVRDLLIPMVADAHNFGLRAYHLRKHLFRVDRFYTRIIEVNPSSQELVSKYQKRFQRYRGSLFTFLDADGIPWNNNAAERALRHFAVQRKISGAFSSKGAKDYLLLLGLSQSCRFHNKSFLGFLQSGLLNLDSYVAPRRRNAQSGLRPGP